MLCFKLYPYVLVFTAMSAMKFSTWKKSCNYAHLGAFVYDKNADGLYHIHSLNYENPISAETEKNIFPLSVEVNLQVSVVCDELKPVSFHDTIYTKYLTFPKIEIRFN